MSGPGWNGWSIDALNSRYQPDPGLSIADVPRLKVKWSMTYTGGRYGQPTVVGGRLFLDELQRPNLRAGRENRLHASGASMRTPACARLR